MCGIAGYMGSFDPLLLEKMNDSIAHRGPDDAGTWHDPQCGVGLTHRRLSIIDLSSAGHQPMWDAARQAVITFNGEIYNYPELREELVKDGIVFRGQSDTEVLLCLYLRVGTEMLARLNGIFAFAIWDTRKRELFLARDGVGVKPIYYAETPRGFLFSSEIKALLKEPSLARDIDPVAVAQHLTFLWCPTPRTILSAVKKLEPGTAFLLRDCKVARRWRFYDLPNGQGQPICSVDIAVDLVQRGLQMAVERQMIADVPVGAFLSGGLDSSAVVAFARRYSKEKLQCFTIAIQGQEHKIDGNVADLPYARKVAAHLGVDLHTVTVGSDMIDHLMEMIYFLDEPQADPAPINALLICKLAREHGIKVLLSGAGGDDIFTGYRRHHAIMQEPLWSWLPMQFRQGICRFSQKLPAHALIPRRIRKALEYAGLNGAEHLSSYFYWFDPHNVGELLSPEIRRQVADGSVPLPLINALKRLPAQASNLDRMLYLEGKFFLADHNLNYTDKMSMSQGVEVRVPLLDTDIVALAARLPDKMKQRGSTGKWIFKKAMEPYLPRDVIYRPKTGFGAPLRRWLRNELRPLVEDVLSPRALKLRGLFDPIAVQKLLQSDREGRVDAAYPIFAMICIELWCQIFLE